jgi:hypothetical protein
MRAAGDVLHHYAFAFCILHFAFAMMRRARGGMGTNEELGEMEG